MTDSPASRKRIVITGVTRGLGRALVDRFADLGHSVAGCGRSPAGIAELQRAHGAPHVFDVLDVTQDADVADWSGRLLRDFGSPDLLINNAAVINANALLWEVPVSEFDRVVDINIKGVVNVIRHFLPAMIARGSGVIVNMSSEWGRSTAPEVAPYCATKWAIEGLTRALAQELPRGLAAVPLSPGIINTDMLRSCFGDLADRYPSPRDWAESAAPFLLCLGPRDNGQPRSLA